MSTDAKITFYYSDSVKYITLYTRYNADPEYIREQLSKYLRSADIHAYLKGRLNWHYLATDVLGMFILNNECCRILPNDTDFKGIYNYEVHPLVDGYSDGKLDIMECVVIKEV